ncbi:RepB family DNA primase [Paracoccaceae bacterium]|nr:RepB family DNA primase [Paracoccaceae bacterium]
MNKRQRQIEPPNEHDINLPLLRTDPLKGGEGGVSKVTNLEFIDAVFPRLPKQAYAAVSTKNGDPTKGGYTARRADQATTNLAPTANNYVNCSSFYHGENGSLRALKGQFAACHFLMLDDLGTKVDLDRFKDFDLSWLIETSPSNYQAGIILSEPITDGPVAERLLNGLIDAKLCDAGANQPLTRWARLPVAINGKPAHQTENGAPFQCRLIDWRPEHRYSPEAIVEGLQLKLAPAGRPKKTKVSGKSLIIRSADEGVHTPAPTENSVIAALKDHGLYKTPLGEGKHDITCPWVNEHTDAIDHGTAYFEPDDQYASGGFKCQHSHGDQYRLGELLDFLEMQRSQARNKPLIRVIRGELHRVVDAAEKELASRGRHFQLGGLIVSVSTDPTSGDPSIIPTTAPALTRELSIAATWEIYDGRSECWVLTDPPVRHVNVLYDAQKFTHLPPLAGLARQPYFSEADRKVIAEPGYNSQTHRFGVFDARQFALPEPTVEAAQEALSLLEGLLSEFFFVADADKTAALAAMMTATVRPTLSHAPAFHVRAPTMGSGKTYLCELIGAFAGPGLNNKVSYPTSSEEATKVILSLLLTGPAVIEFDDMDTDWAPHGVIKRALTAEQITERILGVSKTASVSTRTLFLGSGNNVGPIRDLLRRVITIHLDPQCETPATIDYDSQPLKKVRQDRGKYVSAVLTLIQAWRNAGAPQADISSIATFNGSWSEYCRHPLIWLGLPDPATSLLEQLNHSPDSDDFGNLMKEWHATFGNVPTTVRKAKQTSAENSSLMDALLEFPIDDFRGELSPTKLGQLLGKNANRIIGGYQLQPVKADGRKGWRVVKL